MQMRQESEARQKILDDKINKAKMNENSRSVHPNQMNIDV